MNVNDFAESFGILRKNPVKQRKIPVRIPENLSAVDMLHDTIDSFATQLSDERGN